MLVSFCIVSCDTHPARGASGNSSLKWGRGRFFPRKREGSLIPSEQAKVGVQIDTDGETVGIGLEIGVIAAVYRASASDDISYDLADRILSTTPAV